MKTRMESDRARAQVYKVLSVIAVIIIAILFTFPLYWIITGAFKTGKEINSTTPIWIPSEWDMGNFQRLMSKRTYHIICFKTINLQNRNIHSLKQLLNFWYSPTYIFGCLLSLCFVLLKSLMTECWPNRVKCYSYMTWLNALY